MTAHPRTFGVPSLWTPEQRAAQEPRVTVADRVVYGAHAETVAAARDVMQPPYAEERDAEHRSAAFPDGWWLIPAAMAGAAGWGWLIVAAITAANAVQVGGL